MRWLKGPEGMKILPAEVLDQVHVLCQLKNYKAGKKNLRA